MKILTVVGARPQFIKAAPLSRRLRKNHTEILVHTGQHYDYQMSQVFFEGMNIPAPDHELGVGSGSHAQQTANMLAGLERVMLAERPDVVLVYGDTNSTLAGAVVAAKLGIPIAHVEAGLRSFNMTMPEEINRILTDRVSTVLYCPTQTAVDNLRHEGIANGVELVGDVMHDAAMEGATRAEQDSRILERLKLQRGEYVLATIHRASNTDDPANLRAILHALIEHKEPIVLPLHPRTSKCVEQAGLMDELANAKHIQVIEPLGYLDFVMLERSARLIITDSGGVQKEACYFQVPCVTLREETEWVETVESGWNVLVGADSEKIGHELRRDRSHGLRPRICAGSDLWDGKASDRIASHLNCFS
jgi:UDP-N-acetylglucosamine 2-epimerase